MILTYYVGNAMGAKHRWAMIRGSIAGIIILILLNQIITYMALQFEEYAAALFFKEEQEAKDLFSEILIAFIVFNWIDSIQSLFQEF